MAAQNPPYVIQGQSHPADGFRRGVKALREQAGAVGTGDMAVTQNGTPNMSVNVAAGQAAIDGTENTTLQGTYEVTNDATVNLSIAASDPTNPRNDLVVAKIQDSNYSGGTQAWSLAVVTGTPAGSPVDPATPANAIVIARVRVDATVTSIVNAKITDLRAFLHAAIFPGQNGFTLWDSTGALKNAAWTDAGVMTLRNALAIPNAVNATLPGTTYGTVQNVIDYQTPSAVASIVIPAAGSLPTGYRHLKILWKLKSSSAVVAENFAIRFNGSAVANYFDEFVQSLNAVVTGVEDNNALLTQGSVGIVPGTTAPANSFGSGEITIFDYNSATDHKTYLFAAIARRAVGASGAQLVTGGGGWVIAPVAITTITLLATGNLTGFVTTAGVP